MAANRLEIFCMVPLSNDQSTWTVRSVSTNP